MTSSVYISNIGALDYSVERTDESEDGVRRESFIPQCWQDAVRRNPVVAGDRVRQARVAR